MIEINATEFQRHFAQYQDAALVQPIAITKHDRPRLVMMSYKEYKNLRHGWRQALHVTELTDADMAAIAAARVPAEYAHLDEELDDE